MLNLPIFIKMPSSSIEFSTRKMPPLPPGSGGPPAPPMAIQRQLKEDWDNREFVHVMADNVRQIAEFLANFELNCKSKLAALNDSISALERKVEFLEARVNKGETLN